MASEKGPEEPRRHLGLWDTVSIIVGIVIGAGIYETPPLILRNVSGPGMALAVWGLGGFLSLMGALTYAELASTYPRSGGDYVYLSRAYSPCVGFLFGWAQLAVIMTGSIGMMAYVFATYAAKLWDFGPHSAVVYAGSAIVVFTALNIFGVVLGKTAQNIMSITKLLGLLGILAAGFLAAAPAAPVLQSQAAATPDSASLAFALVLVLFTYGGWNDAAFFVAEMRDRRRIWQALLIGIALITLVYVAVNAAYLRALGFEAARNSQAIAADTLAPVLGESGSRAMSLLVMVSALGAVNGLVFAGSRLYATLGADYRIFRRLGQWNSRWRSPVWSLAVQAAIALTMVVTIGSRAGQSLLNSAFQNAGLGVVAWEGRGGFDTLLRCTAPIFWLFFLLTSLSLFVLRYKDRTRPRVFSVPLYPLPPLIFSGLCAYMLYGGIAYAGQLGLVGAGLLLVGLPLYWLSKSVETAPDVAQEIG